jgi:hypothetical protein
MKQLNEVELRDVEGGSSNPTYDLKDNYDGVTYSSALFLGFICGLFGLR